MFWRRFPTAQRWRARCYKLATTSERTRLRALSLGTWSSSSEEEEGSQVAFVWTRRALFMAVL